MANILVSIDIGSGLAKGKSAGRVVVIPSNTGPFMPSAGFDFGIKKHEVVRFNDEHYVIGDSATATLPVDDVITGAREDWAIQPGYMAMFYGVIAGLYPEGLEGEVAVVTGLPIRRFAEQKGPLTARLIGRHQFSTQGAIYDITVTAETVAVVPQVMGLYFLLGERMAELPLAKMHVGLIDPGTFTTGLAAVDGGYYQRNESNGFDEGMMKLATSLQEELARRHNWRPRRIQVLLKAMRAGKAKDSDKEIDLVELAQPLIPTVFADTIDHIKTVWDSGHGMALFASSGGGEYLLETLQQLNPGVRLLTDTKGQKAKQDKRAADDPVLDVVSGYELYGRALGLV